MSKKRDIPKVLVVAGSDSSGGAGIQADIKTISNLGCYAATAITAVTVQNTKAVLGIYPVPPEIVASQIKAILDDFSVDVVKTGMLLSGEIILEIAKVIQANPKLPLIVDPVMVATSGGRLFDTDSISVLKEKLIAKALLVTPNIPEAEILSGLKINLKNGRKDIEAAARKILETGVKSVLIKGGHSSGKTVTDYLFMDGKIIPYVNLRIDTSHTHGTGCTLASAIACYYASGNDLENAVRFANNYVHRALLDVPGIGRGYGPIGVPRVSNQ